MTSEELDRLAEEIVAALLRSARPSRFAPRDGGATWLPSPVRPAPAPRSDEAPSWSGAAQSLGDIAPIRRPMGSAYRADDGTGTADIRAAAAGLPSPIDRGAASQPSAEPPRKSDASRRRRWLAVEVPIGVSKHHVHLSEPHWRSLFGSAMPTRKRDLSQPGQFAAHETIAVEGPGGRLDSLRVVGPFRRDTQVELAGADCARLGIDPPLAVSGRLETSTGGVTLVGPHGRLAIDRGVIVAARHLHLAPPDAARWGLRDGDWLDVRCGSGARAVTWHDVLVRCGPSHATEMHVDEDEARAAQLVNGSLARIVSRREGSDPRRTLVTEQMVIALARRGEVLPRHALLTPSARDRARAIGLELP